jgi:hypothetical protein
MLWAGLSWGPRHGIGKKQYRLFAELAMVIAGFGLLSVKGMMKAKPNLRGFGNLGGLMPATNNPGA